MLSDDDRLLVLKSAPNGRDHGAGTNGNGHYNGRNDDFSMSEDDDLPLVRYDAFRNHYHSLILPTFATSSHSHRRHANQSRQAHPLEI